MSAAVSSNFAPPAATARWIEVVSHLDPRYGGLSSVVPQLAHSLTQLTEPIDVSLAAFCSPDEQTNSCGLDSDQLNIWSSSRTLWLKDSFSGNTLQQSFVEQLRGADGLHIHGLWEQSTSIAAASARALGLPYILSAHGMLEPWALSRSRIKKFFYGHLVERKNIARAKILHALTIAEAEQLVRFGARSPIAVIPNAVKIPAKTSSSLFLRAFPALSGKRVVLFMARLHPKKGLNLLIDAWEHIAHFRPDAHLVLAGPDFIGTQARLEQLVAQRGLTNSVLFTGMLDGHMKAGALAAAEAFVLPSFSEGLSVAVLEAMACGLPVIITEPCNMPEILHVRAGWQIRPALKPLVSALHELLQNSASQNDEMGYRGAALIRTRYSWPVVAQQMSEVYRWASGGPKPQSVDMIFPS